MIDLRRALPVLIDHGVRFVLIGGQAAVARGSSSLTRDLDICYDRAPDNLDRLAAALTAMHARPRAGAGDVLDALRGGDPAAFETDFGALDAVATPAGTTGYADLLAGADRMDLGGFAVDVVALDDLIRMKRAAGRPKDRVEVEILIALRDEITERG